MGISFIIHVVCYDYAQFFTHLMVHIDLYPTYLEICPVDINLKILSYDLFLLPCKADN